MSILYVSSSGGLFAERLVGPIHPDDWHRAQDIADEMVERDRADPEKAADGIGASQQVDLLAGWPEGQVFPAGRENAAYGLPTEASAVGYRLAAR